NLRQTGLAALLHAEIHKHLPSGGWGNEWIGFRDRGFGPDQPGGWIFNILPFCEAQSIRDLGPATSIPLAPTRMSEFVTSTIAVLICPERGGDPYVNVTPRYQFSLGGALRRAARTDYAICSGSGDLETLGGPATLDPGDTQGFAWPSFPDFNGVSHIRSRIRLRDIHDGLSQVILIGERFSWCEIDDEGENQPMYSGDCWDIRRSTHLSPARDANEIGNASAFGSAHASETAFLFCDGSVRNIAYDVNPLVYIPLGGRNDSGRVPD
ncbi:MAG TPA: DUF1559 domain-containing protein, partial [Pirellulaceae bacterium]